MEGAPLRKMEGRTAVDGTSGTVRMVDYKWGSTEHDLQLAERIGTEFTVRFTGQRTCMLCGTRVKKFYGQGTCFPCLRNAAGASPCIIRPELCGAHRGEGRDPQWELEHHMQEHVVYLSFTGGVKVGVTRATQVPTRWIDQGALLAVPIARVPYRQLAGAMEVDLKRLFSDRTDWRRMLLLADGAVGMDRLLAAREQALSGVDPGFGAYLLPAEPVVQLAYPLSNVPPKLVAVQLDKLPEIRGKLHGIKGQYLVWSDGRMLNVRNHIGYHVVVE